MYVCMCIYIYIYVYAYIYIYIYVYVYIVSHIPRSYMMHQYTYRGRERAIARGSSFGRDGEGDKERAAESSLACCTGRWLATMRPSTSRKSVLPVSNQSLSFVLPSLWSRYFLEGCTSPE